MDRMVTVITGLVILAAASFAYAQESGAEKDEIQALKDVIRLQKERIDKLTRELREARKEIERLRKEKSAVKKPEPADAKKDGEKTQAAIRGKITEVRMDSEMVLRDIGSSSGISGGDVLEVSRAGKKIGRIKVCTIINENLSNAEILEANVDFIPGDSVVRIAPAPTKPGGENADKTGGEVEQAAHSPSTGKVPPGGAASSSQDINRTDKLLRRLETLEGLYADLARQVDRLRDRLERSIGEKRN